MRAEGRTDSQKFGGWDRFGPSVSVATPYFEEGLKEGKMAEVKLPKREVSRLCLCQYLLYTNGD